MTIMRYASGIPIVMIIVATVVLLPKLLEGQKLSKYVDVIHSNIFHQRSEITFQEECT